MMIRTKYSVFKYLTIAESDNLWGLYVTGSGSADLPPNTSYPPTKHPDAYMFDSHHGRILHEFQIIYITRGKGSFESKATGKKQIEEGTLMILFPGIWHRYMPDQRTGWREHWISFNGIQPQKFSQYNILSPEKAVIKIGLDETLIQLYQKVLELIESENVGFRETITALTYQIIAQIITKEKLKKFGSKEIEIIVQNAKTIMMDRIDRQIQIEALAEELGVGYSWFRRMFRHYTGLPPIQYFLQLKLNKAKNLLLSTTLSVKEIAMITGFESQYYFSKFFKKRMGVSPIQLRTYSRGEKTRREDNNRKTMNRRFLHEEIHQIGL
ncbi:AraC family transcriptional regulator [bacterium]|nr:AraC family transcriptional regulator [bacterium]